MRAAAGVARAFLRTALIAVAAGAVVSLAVGSDREAGADGTTASMAFRVFTDTSKSVQSCDIGVVQRQCTIIGDNPFSVHVIAKTPPPTGFHTYRVSVRYAASMTLNQQVGTSENVWPFCNPSFASEVKGVNTYRTDCATGGTTNIFYTQVIVHLHFSCPAAGGLFQIDLLAGTGTDASRYIRAGSPSTVFLKSVDKGGTLVGDAVVIECLADTDDDGMPDVYEKAHACLNQAVHDTAVDHDSDGLMTGEEFDLGLDPCDDDTDNDELLDGEEVNGVASPKPALGVFFTDPFDPDTDKDGCRDGLEVGLSPPSGGGRDPTNLWDIFDIDTENGRNAGTHLQGAVVFSDVLAVANRFGQTGNPIVGIFSDAKAPGYHPRYDRGASVGPNAWNRGPADGTIALSDVLSVANQFGHICS